MRYRLTMTGRLGHLRMRRVFFALASLTGLARAQNVDSFYLSGDAALQGGAITADARGGGSIWYNPAGLAELRGLRFDVNVSAYALGFGGHPDLEATRPGTTITRLTVLDLRAVPAAMSLTKRFGNVGVGFGMFVPNEAASYLRTRIQQPAADGYPAVDFGVHVDSSEEDYFGGPGFGISLGPAVDIGGSLFVHYRTQLVVSAVDAAIDAGEYGSVAVTSHQLFDSIQIGWQPVFGVQIHPQKQWQLGITLRMPSFLVYQILQTIVAETSNSSVGEDAHHSDFQDTTGFSSSLAKPPRAHVGFSYDFGQTRMALETSYQFPLYNEDLHQDMAPLFNARVGGKHAFKDKLQVGGGLFTNLSATRQATQFGESKIDYFGVTAALHLGTPYEVAKRGGQTLRPFGFLNFGSTVALSYSLGVGKVVRAQVGLGGDSTDLYREVQADVVAHELVFTWASSISE